MSDEQTTEAKIKVLIAEDDEFLRGLLAQKLSKESFEVFYATDGAEAVALSKQEVPNVALLDVIMPGVNGFEALEQMKLDPVTAHIPVVFLSNLGQEEDIRRGQELGAVEFLVKANYSLDAIVKKIEEIATDPQFQKPQASI